MPKKPPIAIKNINQYIQALAEKSNDVFWIRNADYSEQIYVSPSYEKVWERKSEELYSHPEQWNTFIVPEDIERMKKSISLRNKEVKPTDVYSEWYRILRPNGDIRWIKDQSFPIFSEEEKHIGFAGIAQDVTVEKQKERTLNAAKEQAEAANQAKTEFIANMSHDLKSPLHAILGMAEILQLKEHSAEQKEYIEGIMGSGQVILKLVNDILNFATIQEGRTDPLSITFNLRSLIEEAVSTISLQASQKNVGLILSYPEPLDHQFIGDPQAINRVLINLLSNAIKYTDKGHISVSLEVTNTYKNEILLKLIIEDSGIGIGEEHLPYIFDRFYRTSHSYNSRYKGTGLGLSIAKELIKQMNGDIQAESTIGKGSRFCCFIPLKLIDTTSKSESSKVIEVQKLRLPKCYRVLLVEDNLFAQKVSHVFLQQLGCKIDLAHNAAEALEQIRNKPYEIIFMDLGLPDQNGLEVTDLIRKTPGLNQNSPIIGLTAHASPEEEMQGRHLGMNHFITKPASLLDLYQAILKVMT